MNMKNKSDCIKILNNKLYNLFINFLYILLDKIIVYSGISQISKMM